uniref:Uncharacterized protein n=1 Tax=viral metagenome TaxID=1070528 RepID=A0A6H1ZG48_9ZZZZ
MNAEESIQKLEEIEKAWTWDTDKSKANSTIKRVRDLVIKKDLLKHVAIKDLISLLSSEIQSITRFLAWDEKATDDIREKKYIKRDAYIFLLSIFGDPDKELEDIGEKVEEDYKQIKEDAI